MARKGVKKTIIVHIRYKIIDGEVGNLDEIKRLLGAADDKAVRVKFAKGENFIEKLLTALLEIQEKVGRNSKMMLSIGEAQ